MYMYLVTVNATLNKAHCMLLEDQPHNKLKDSDMQKFKLESHKIIKINKINSSCNICSLPCTTTQTFQTNN